MAEQPTLLLLISLSTITSTWRSREILTWRRHQEQSIWYLNFRVAIEKICEILLQVIMSMEE